ncbi:MAG: hypothetical protein SOT41_05335 [Candidatus Faecisoma sp.]|nr:hypothetical protein [Candidatus Faecisoma sp.]
MVIRPTNEVRIYKNVPFSIDYKNIMDFSSVAEQSAYFNSLPQKTFSNLTYTRNNGTIIVNGNRDTLLDYNYMSFVNKDYGNKIFYAFITNVRYSSANASYIDFVIDEWQTWCFDINFKESFIERKHCKRWKDDGTPVINTQDEGLDFGSEYIVKDHREYNNDLYWVCLVTSLFNSEVLLGQPQDVPTILSLFYYPVYKTTNKTIVKWRKDGKSQTGIPDVLNAFRTSSSLSNKLVSAFIISEPPFEYAYTIDNTTNEIVIRAEDLRIWEYQVTDLPTISLPYRVSSANPHNVLRTFPKYGNLKNNITESKLLMYPYSYVQIVDGQGNSFDIKNEYLDDTQINVRTFTSGGLNSKQAHIVEHYRYKGVTLNYCRWELGNGVVNSFPNNLTISDAYSAAYLQGNANQINQSINATLNQSQLNNIMAQNTARASQSASLVRGVGDTIGGGILQPLVGAGNGIKALGDYAANVITSEQQVKNTELQGNLTSENAVKSALAKKQDAQNVADNVSLQGGDVYFTYQNQYSGYCLVYKQISDEYIRVLEDYFKKYGYAYNKIETPLLRTRKSWDYIRCIDANITGNINDNSLEKIKTIFNQGVTIWHTSDVGNYSLNNDERT